MPAGSMAVYREATGGEDRDSVSDQNVTFDTTVVEDTRVFEMQANRYDVKLKESGHYLMLGNECNIADTGTDRVMHHARFQHNAADMDCKSSGYIRMLEGCNQNYISLACIQDIRNAGNNFKMVVKNVSTTTGANASRRANLSGLSLLKLDDSWDYCRLNPLKTGVLQILGGVVAWYTQDEYDSGSFNHFPSIRPSRIFLTKVGWYLFTWTIDFTCVAVPPSRCICVPYISRNSTVIYDNSPSGSYGRQIQGCQNGVESGISLIYNDSTSNYVELYAATGGGGGANLNSAGTWIQAVKLPDEVINILQIDDNSGGQSVDVSQTPFDYDQQLIKGSAFEHSTTVNPDNVTIKKPGPFLFIGNNRFNRASGINRYNTLGRFRLNGTPVQYGNGGIMSRGNAVLNTGYSQSLILPSLNLNDIVELSREDESSSSGTAPLTVINACGLTGLYLPSIFPPQGGQWIEHAY